MPLLCLRCICFSFMCASVPAGMHVRHRCAVLTETRRGHWFPWNWNSVAGSEPPTMGVLGTTPSSLEEQQELLSSEPPPQLTKPTLDLSGVCTVSHIPLCLFTPHLLP